MSKLGRNDPCHCGSGKKYKHCHLAPDEAAERAARVKAAEEADAAAKAEAAAKGEPVGEEAPRPTPKGPGRPASKPHTNVHSYQRMSTPRKVGGS